MYLYICICTCVFVLRYSTLSFGEPARCVKIESENIDLCFPRDTTVRQIATFTIIRKNCEAKNYFVPCETLITPRVTSNILSRGAYRLQPGRQSYLAKSFCIFIGKGSVEGEGVARVGNLWQNRKNYIFKNNSIKPDRIPAPHSWVVGIPQSVQIHAMLPTLSSRRVRLSFGELFLPPHSVSRMLIWSNLELWLLVL